MESINFLNTGTSANNTATFAASMTSNSLPTSGGVTQTSNFNDTSRISFSEHLQNSIEPVKSSNETKLSVDDLTILAEEIMEDINNTVQKNIDNNLSPSQKTDAINQLINDLKLTDDSLKDIQKLISDIDSIDEESIENVLNSMKSILSELKNTVSNDISNKVTTTNAQITDEALIITNDGTSGENVVTDLEVDAIASTVINAKEFNAKELDTVNIKNKLETISVEQSDVINTEINIDINLNASENLIPEDVKSNVLDNNEISADNNLLLVNEIEKKLKDIDVILVDSEITPSNNELLVDIKDVLEKLEQIIVSSDIKNEKLSSEIAEIQQLLFPINAEISIDKINEKVVELINKLPIAQQQALMAQYRQNSNAVESNQLSTDDLLMTIEKSHEALNDVIDDVSFINTLATKPDASNKTAAILNKFDFSASDKLISIDESIKSTILNSASNDESIDSFDLDTMLSQLESNFKNSGQAQAVAEDIATASSSRVEQQAIKDLNSLQTSTVKTPEIIPQKVTLNDSPMAAAQLKEHLIMMSRGGINQAVLQLDPEELGAMSVRIVMQNDQMNVQFQVQNPNAKEMLEQTMDKLKESLQEQGIALNQSDVEQQNQQRGQAQSAQDLINDQLAEELDEDDSQVITMTLNKQSSNGIDYYA